MPDRPRDLLLLALAAAAATFATSAAPVASTVPPSSPKVTVSTGHAAYPGGPTYDAYLPTDERTDRPALVLVHGGGWRGGDRSELAPYAVEVAEKRGWAAFTIDYRTEATTRDAWPAALHDVQAAIRAIAADAATYGIETSKLVLLGDSAGANLVAMVSSVGTADPVSGEPVGVEPSVAVPVRAVALWSPPTDLASLAPRPGDEPPACGDNQACDGLWSGPTVTDYVGCPPDACPQTYQAASPISHVSPSTAPTYVANSTDELVPLTQARAYVDALQHAGVAHRLKVVQGQLHGSQLGPATWGSTVAFLADHVPGEGGHSGGRWYAGGIVAVLVAVAAVALVRAGRGQRARRPRPSAPRGR